MNATIGIDLGGTNVKGVLLDDTGKILAQHYIATDDGPGGKWKERIAEMVRHLKSLSSNKVSVIGLSCPGLANESNTSITHMPGRLHGLENFIWDDYFGTKTYVVNDAHAALMAESKLGVLQGCTNAVLLTLGTGVGGAILINGGLYQGLHQMAGHFGHTVIDVHDDELSLLGMPGSLEYALGNYSVKRRSMGRFASTQEMVNGYQNNDAFATWLWLDSVRKLAITIASLANALSPEIVVLAGGIPKAGDALFKPLQAFMDIFEFRPHANTKTVIKQAMFSDLSGAIGAAVFAQSRVQA
jgi:glucokinase